MQKSKSLVIVSIAYLSALLIAAFYLIFFKSGNVLFDTLIADIIATIVIFAFGRFYKNSSLYDPYWSVIPVFIIFYWILLFDSEMENSRLIIVFIMVFVWGLRLTLNWIRRWKGMLDEDFRYIDLKQKTGKAEILIDFMGIQLFPTLIVFLGLWPVFLLSKTTNTINIVDMVAAFIGFGGILLEAIADRQLHNFKSIPQNKGKRLNSGFWKHIKYPNYLGENMLWWSLFIFSLAADTENLKAIAAPLAMSLMFIFVSIPMMKKRLKAKTK